MDVFFYGVGCSTMIEISSLSSILDNITLNIYSSFHAKPLIIFGLFVTSEAHYKLPFVLCKNLPSGGGGSTC